MTKHYGICAEDFYFTKFNGKRYIKYSIGSIVPLTKNDFWHIKQTGKFEVLKTASAYFPYSRDLAEFKPVQLSSIVKETWDPRSGFLEEIYER